MRFLKRFRKEIILFIFISAIYFFFRLIFLDRLPIFTDEAIYVRWAQIAQNDASWRFISLTDGKQPMFVWLAMIFMEFIKDPLLAGRFVSVVSGFFTMAGLFLLTLELFKRKSTAFIVAFLYIVYPFAQVNDRMALYDSMVAAFCIWAFYFSILLVRKLKLDIAYTLGFILGGGILTKSNAFFSIYLLPFTLLLFDFKKAKLKNRFIRWVLLAGFASALAYGMYNVLRLSPLFEIISIKNANFAYPVSQWLMHPFTFFLSNLSGFLSWLTQYLGISYMVLILISLIMFKKFFKEKLLLFTYFFLPFIAICLFGNVIYPRFIYFMSLYLIPLAAWGLNFIIDEARTHSYRRKKHLIVKLSAPFIILVFSWHQALVSYQFAADPINAKIATADNSQYVNSWAAGWGVKESISFFNEKGKDQKIYIATEGTFGLMPEAMEMYLLKNKNITVKGYWPISKFPKEVEDVAKQMPTYFIFYQPEHRVIPPEYPLKLVFQVRQGNSDFYYRVYQVLPRQ